MHQLIEGLSGIEVVADDFIVIGCGNTIEEANSDHDRDLISFLERCKNITNINSADLEVERRIQSATKAYSALQKRLGSCNDISTKTKVKVYSVAVIPCLLYSIECTTLYRRHIMALTRLELRHLRSILNIKWQDGIPDVEVLRRANTVSVEALITVSQLRWAGHVRRMANSRLPKAVFYSELRQGKKNHG